MKVARKGGVGGVAARRLSVLAVHTFPPARRPLTSSSTLGRTWHAHEGWSIERLNAAGEAVAEGQEAVRVTWMASNPVNCINPTFLDHLDHTLAVLERDNATRPSPVVFASASERTFCAGLDLKAVLAMSREELTHFIDRLNQSYLRLLTLACPTVAAVNGHAIAGGALVALSADYRVSASSSKVLFGVNEVRLGIPFPSGPWAVLRHVAASRPLLNGLILNGELVSLEDAHRHYGLIDHVVSGTDLVQGSIKFIGSTVHSHSWRAFAAVKAASQKAVVERYEKDRSEGKVDGTFIDIFFSDDARRAIKRRLAKA